LVNINLIIFFINILASSNKKIIYLFKPLIRLIITESQFLIIIMAHASFHQQKVKITKIKIKNSAG